MSEKQTKERLEELLSYLFSNNINFEVAKLEGDDSGFVGQHIARILKRSNKSWSNEIAAAYMAKLEEGIYRNGLIH